jgi:hypothetical protein
MRLYSQTVEENIRTERLVREWARSGLIGAAQIEPLTRDLNVNLQRTNVFLRIILFAFGALVAGACVLFSVELLDIGANVPTSLLCFVWAGICYGLAEVIARRVYRFGVEESLAAGTIALFGLGAGLLSPDELLAGLLAGSAASVFVYLRFGYVYAAIGSIALLAASAFQMDLSETTARAVVVLMLLPIFVMVYKKRLAYGDNFPGDDYAAIAAIVWAGMYTAVNIALFEQPILVFRWPAYALTWLLPATGLYIAFINRDRLLLDANLAMALATLITNKTYLGAERQTWDPILLGVLLIGVALAARRWLAGDPYGFTASRLLSADKRALAIVGTASTAVQPDVPPASQVTPEFKPGGGRSGGAGASGSF